MLSKKSFLFFPILLLQFAAFSQTPKIDLQGGMVDFGVVEEWNNPPAVFLFSNTGDAPLMFLPLFAEDDVRISFPNHAIKPGESGRIEVFYLTLNTGKFSRTVEIYSSASEKPIKITVKGDIKYITQQAMMECPQWGTEPKLNKADFDFEVLVIDSFNHEPIAGAGVNISSPLLSITLTTNSKGKARDIIIPGQYLFLAESEDYYSYKVFKYINQNDPIVIIELAPIVDEPIFALKEDTGEVQTKVVDEPIDTIAPPEPEIVLEPVEDKIELPVSKYLPNNIIFLIDVSSSMKSKDKLPVLKIAMKNLSSVLRDIDQVALITYANETNVILESTSADEKQVIQDKIDSLKSSGFTFGVKGLTKAYEIAQANFIPEANNQIILATDGMFNSPDDKDSNIFDLVNDKAEDGITLSVIGFGKDVKGTQRMKKLAKKGNGTFLYIVNEEEAKNILIEEIKLQSKK